MGGRDVVVLGHAIWARRFGSNPRIIGQTIQADGISREVIGVMPPGVEFPLRSELWIPLAVLGEGSRDATWRALHRGARAPEARRADRRGARRNAHHRQPAGAAVSAHQPRQLGLGASAARIAGRQRPAIDVRAAGRGGPRAADRLRQRRQPRADSRRRPRPRAGRARGRRRGPIQPVSRPADREPRARRDRRRRRVWCSRIGPPPRSRRSIPRSVCRCSTRPVSTSWSSAFAFGVAVLAAVLFGTMPAWQATSITDVVSRIREEAGSTTSDPKRQRTRGLLIVAETTLAVVLLVGAGLLTRSFARLLAVDLGFSADAVQTFSIGLPGLALRPAATAPGVCRNAAGAHRRRVPTSSPPARSPGCR